MFRLTTLDDGRCNKQKRDLKNYALTNKSVLLLETLQVYDVSSHRDGRSSLCSTCILFSHIILATLAAKHKADNVFSCASCFALILRARFYIQIQLAYADCTEQFVMVCLSNFHSDRKSVTFSLGITHRIEQFVISSGVFIIFS